MKGRSMGGKLTWPVEAQAEDLEWMLLLPHQPVPFPLSPQSLQCLLVLPPLLLIDGVQLEEQQA